MSPHFPAFVDELHRIELEKRSSPVGWLKSQYNHLGVAAGQAMASNTTHSALTGMKAVPILDTLKNFIGNKMPTAKKPPGPILQKVQKAFSSKPVQTGIDLLGQTGEFLKLAGRAHSFPKTQKCARCSKPATTRIFWCEHRAYQPACDGHVAAVTAHLKTQNYGEIDGVEKIAQVSPYQQKTQYSCSAACLKAVLEHWGFDRFSEFELMHEIGVKDKGGAEVDQITEAAKRLGLSAYDKCFASLEEARQLTDKEIPIIADFQSFNNPGKGHYVVIVSIDDDIVHLMDPNTEGNARVITRAECEQRWWDRTMAPPHTLMPKWGIVIEPRG